jgi:nitrogen-specific signal transduction histidine kinase
MREAYGGRLKSPTLSRMHVELPAPVTVAREEALRLLARALLLAFTPLTVMLLSVKLSTNVPGGRLPVLLETGTTVPFAILLALLLRPSPNRSQSLRGLLAVVCISMLSGWALVWNGPRPANVVGLALALSLSVLFFHTRRSFALVVMGHLTAAIVGHWLRRVGIIALTDESQQLSVLFDVGSTLLTILGLSLCTYILWVTLENYRKGQQELVEHARQLLEAQRESQRLQRQQLVAQLTTALAAEVADVVQALGDGADLLAPQITDVHGRQVLTHMRSASTRASQLLRLLGSLEASTVASSSPADIHQVLTHLDETLPTLLGTQVSLDVLNTSRGRPLVQSARLEQVLIHLALMVRDSMPVGGTVTLRAYDGLGDVTCSDGRRTWTIIEVGRVVLAREQDPFAPPLPSAETDVMDLGLALVHHAIGDAGGRLEVERRGPVGTQYIVQLPSLAA